MTLDEIKEMWAKDCEIDDIELDSASLNVPRLHAKYSDLLTDKLTLKKQTEFQYNILLKEKWMWYNRKLDDERLKELGWNSDPFDGLKIMKSDFSYFYNADKDLQSIKTKIEYLDITIDYLKRCMENITWRHQTIKNTIDWRKFMGGQ